MWLKIIEWVFGFVFSGRLEEVAGRLREAESMILQAAAIQPRTVYTPYRAPDPEGEEHLFAMCDVANNQAFLLYLTRKREEYIEAFGKPAEGALISSPEYNHQLLGRIRGVEVLIADLEWHRKKVEALRAEQAAAQEEQAQK